MTEPAKDGFNGLGISDELLGALKKLKYKNPTPIQAKAIPIANEGSDIIGIAQTGTGKTVAFGVPMVQRLAGSDEKGLILVPTRELAMQVNEALQSLTAVYKMKTVVLIGGESIRPQLQRLRDKPRIIVATPGRLNDHLNQRTLHLKNVGVLVLDEADRMLDMGFLPQLENVFKLTPPERQTMLFSATMPKGIIQIAQRFMRLPVRTEIAPEGTAAEEVSQQLYIVKRENKFPLVEQLIEQYTGTILLFVRTRRSASRVAAHLRRIKLSVSEIHADRTLAQRKEAMRRFKAGESRILVATDIAARGIDVKGIQLVLNYDLPDDPENYVHRIGRTGRAGEAGFAVSIATPDQGYDVRRIEQIMRVAIPVSKHADIPVEQFDFKADKAPSSRRPGRRRPFGGHQRIQRKKTGRGGRAPRGRG